VTAPAFPIPAAAERQQAPGAAAMTALARARHLRGWSAVRAAVALETAARARGVALCGRDSLLRMLRAWEHGQRRPGADYRALLCQVYQASEEDLGIGASAEVPRVRLDTEPRGPVLPKPGNAALLRAALEAAGVRDLGPHDRLITDWLSGFETSTVLTIAAWVARAADSRSASEVAA